MTRILLRKSLHACIVLLFIVIHYNLAYAGAYEWGGLGTRAESMGGAFIGLADDWTAIYWNPAGLTQGSGMEWGVDFLSSHPAMTDGNSLSNLPVAQMDTKYRIDTFVNFSGIEPNRFNETKVNYHFYNLNGIGMKGDYAGFSFGGGLYIPVGHYFDWKDTIGYGAGAIEAKLKQRMFLSVYNLSVAKKINRLSLGAGFGLIRGEINYDASKRVNNSGIMDYNWNFYSESSGYGIEYTLGLLFEILDNLNFGAVYRSGSTVRLKGDSDTRLSLTGLHDNSDFIQEFPLPSTWGAGLALKLKSNFILTADFQRTNWTEFKIDVDYKDQTAALANKDYSADWRDSNRYRCGLEYRPLDNMVLRCGYFFDEACLPDKSVSFSNIVDVNRHNFMLGAGYASKTKWDIDLLYGYAFGSRNAEGVKYTQNVQAIGMEISHKF